MTTSFAVTWDYRCPFARIAHDHVIGARAGADWDVTFTAFSLDQAHVVEGETSVWDEPDRFPGLVVNEAGIVVRDRMADSFLDVHEALFAARHDRSADLRDRAVIAKVLEDVGVDSAEVMAQIDDGWPLETFRKEHTEAVDQYSVFGVPTFIVGEDAVFVRLMNRHDGDSKVSTQTIEQVVGLMAEWPALNEFKHTRVKR